MRRLVAATLAGAVVLAGCSSEGEPTDQPVAGQVIAATPAASPVPQRSPAGSVTPLADQVSAMVLDPGSGTLAVAVRTPPRLLLYPANNLAAAPRTVPLPGVVDQLAPPTSGVLLAAVRSKGELLRITLPGGTVERVAVDGGPSGATQVGGRTVVALRDGKGVAVLDGGRLERTITGDFPGATTVLPAGQKAVVLDELRTAVIEVDLAAGTIGSGIRAGEGATRAITDRFGRVLVVDTRSGELMAFSTNPLIMRQRYPVPGAPYAITYDSKRDLAWVTLTERNEVVGYHMAGGEPVEKYRFPTVRQPNSVAVDPESGRVLVASAEGGGVQVVQP